MNARRVLMVCAAALLTVALTAPAGLAASSTVTITGVGDWQVTGTPLQNVDPPSKSIAGEWVYASATDADTTDGLSVTDSDSDSKYWSDILWTPATGYESTITANFLVDADLITANVGDWATVNYWVKMELKSPSGALQKAQTVSGSFNVADGDVLAVEDLAVSVSVTTPDWHIEGNSSRLYIYAWADVEAFPLRSRSLKNPKNLRHRSFRLRALSCSVRWVRVWWVGFAAAGRCNQRTGF
jgi:hypothetical protein